MLHSAREVLLSSMGQPTFFGGVMMCAAAFSVLTCTTVSLTIVFVVESVDHLRKESRCLRILGQRQS
jgi:hypothetical protein